MYPTVKNILALSDFKDCRLLHPGVTCNQPVKSVTIMDNPNILKWLSEYEILLSNGYNLVNFQNREWKTFFFELKKKNVAALFIKLSYFVDKLPQEIIEYTAQLDFPVVIVPNEYSWTTVADPIYQFILEQQRYFIIEAANLRDQLNKLMLQNGCLDDVCSKIAKNLGRPVAVFDRQWNMAASSDDPDWDSVKKLVDSKMPHYFEGLEGPQLEHYPNHRLQADFGKVIFLSWPDLAKDKYVAVIQRRGDKLLARSDIYKLEQAATVVLLQLYKEIEMGRIEKHYYTDFLLDLMDGVLVQREEIDAKIKRLGRKVYKSYQVIVFELEESQSSSDFVDNLLMSIKKEESLIHDVMVCKREAQITLFQPIANAEDRELITKTCSIVSESLSGPRMQFGVSQIYNLDSIHKGYKEALFALSTQRFVDRPVIYYDDLGLLRLFEVNSKKADVSFLSEFYGKTIQPLAYYDSDNDTELVFTLEAFLKCNLSISETAKALFLHENTLRARIKRIEHVLNRSLKTPMDVAELLIGIQIHALIDCKNGLSF